jgi:DNA-binding SARP family transcriptional activator
MDFRLLGPLDVADNGRSVPIGRGRRRSLLALLLMHPNEVVSAERLIDELWGEQPTATATKSLHVYVSQLRKELRPEDAAANGDVLLTRSNGYVVEVAPDDIDVARFERLLAEGQRLLAAGDLAHAGERLRESLALWRGPPLADFAYEPFAQRDIARLEEQRQVALEARIEADLALGRHAQLVGELEALVGEHPLREALRGQLMLALYRCGRQAEALEAYRAGRAALVEELGIEPGPALRELERKILAQDSELAPPATPRRVRARRPPEPRPAPGHGRRPALALALLIAGGAALLAAVVLAVLLNDGNGGSAARAPALDLAENSVAAVEPSSGSPSLVVPLSGRPTALAAAGPALWAVTVESPALTRIDTGRRTITKIVPLPIRPSAVGVGDGAVWVADGRSGQAVRVEAGYSAISAPFRFRRGPPVARAAEATSMAVGAGAVWITDGSSRLVRIDVETRHATGIAGGEPLNGVAFGAGAVWAVSGPGRAVLRIDPATRAVSRLELAGRARAEAPYPAAIAASGDTVWVLNRNTATVVRINALTRAVAAVIPIGVDRVPNAIAAAGQTAWVANGDGSLSRIDTTSATARSIWVGESVGNVASGGGRLWVTTTAIDRQLPGGAG